MERMRRSSGKKAVPKSPGMTLIEEASRSKRALAKLISQVENGAPGSREILQEAYRRSGGEFSLGITGAPGAGKSTLIGGLAERLVKKGYRVAIVAIDPTSPFSGGAFLGDRIRFMGLAGRKGLYVRSMASRGHRGGINRGLLNIIRVLGAARYDFVIIETVGTGQDEVDIGMVTDMTTLVMVPEGGDEIQLLKSGNTEIADVFLVNKADHEGADVLASRLFELQQIKRSKIKVFKTVATDGEGVGAFEEFLIQQQQSLKDEAQWTARRKEKLRREVIHLVEQEVTDGVRRILDQQRDFVHGLTGRMISGQSNPYSLAEELSNPVLNGFEKCLSHLRNSKKGQT